MGQGGVASSKLALGLQTSEDRFRGMKGLARVTKTREPRARTKQGHCPSLSQLGSQLYCVALGRSWTALSPFCTPDQGSSLAGLWYGWQVVYLESTLQKVVPACTPRTWEMEREGMGFKPQL